MRKKALAWLLSLAMVISLMPSAMAEGTSPAGDAADEVLTSETGDAQEGLPAQEPAEPAEDPAEEPEKVPEEPAREPENEVRKISAPNAPAIPVPGTNPPEQESKDSSEAVYVTTTRTRSTTVNPSPIASIALGSSGVQVAGEGKAERWIDRIVTNTDDTKFAMDFYKMLEEATDNDGDKDYLIGDDYFNTAKTSGAPTTGTVGKVTIGVMVDNNAGDVAATGIVAASNVKATDQDSTLAYLQAALDAFDRDHPEVFWLGDGSYWAYSKGNDGDIILILHQNATTKGDDAFDMRASGYTETTIKKGIDNITTYISAISNDTKSGVADAVAGKDPYTMVKAFNAWLTKNNAYNNQAASDGKKNENLLAWECLSGLAGKNENAVADPVCEGYARAFKVLCDRADPKIPCVLVSGTGDSGGKAEENKSNPNKAHMWNYVQLDGKWYAVDVTWNDPVIEVDQDGDGNENYLLVGSETKYPESEQGKKFSETHYVSNTVSVDPVTKQPGHAFTPGPTLETTKYTVPLGVTFTLENEDAKVEGDNYVFTYNGKALKAVDAGAQDYVKGDEDITYKLTGGQEQKKLTAKWYGESKEKHGQMGEELKDPAAPKDAGTYWLVVSTEDESASKDQKVIISKADLKDAVAQKQFDETPLEFPYTGEAVTAEQLGAKLKTITTTLPEDKGDTLNLATVEDGKTTGDYTISISESKSAVGTNYPFTIEATEGCTNYKGTYEGTYEITKGAKQELRGEHPLRWNGGSQTATLESLLKEAGVADEALAGLGTIAITKLEITSNTQGVLSTVTNEGNTVTFNLGQGDGDGLKANDVGVKTATVTITFSSANYGNNDNTLEVTINLTDKFDIPADKILVEAASLTKTYNGSAQKIGTPKLADDITADAATATWTVVYEGAVEDAEQGTDPGAKDAGTYTVTVIYEDKDYKGTKEVEFKINKAVLTVSVTVADKEYDETDAATIAENGVKFTGLAKPEGVEETLTVNVDYEVTASFADENASDSGKEVNYTVTLKQADTKTKNYTFMTEASGDTPAAETAACTGKTTAKIKRRTVSDITVSLEKTEETFTGSSLESVIKETVKGNVPDGEDSTKEVTLVKGTDYSVTLEGDTTNAGEVKVKVSPLTSGNNTFTAPTEAEIFTITPKEITLTGPTITHAAATEGPQTYSLISALGEVWTYGQISALSVAVTAGGDAGILDGDPAVSKDTGDLTYKLAAGSKADGSVVLTVTVTSPNYVANSSDPDAPLTFTVTITIDSALMEQAPLVLKINDSDSAEVTYDDGTTLTLTLTGGSGDGAVSYTTTVEGVIAAPAAGQQEQALIVEGAGTVTITATKAADASGDKKYPAAQSNPVTITVKKITLSATDVTCEFDPESGTTLADAVLSGGDDFPAGDFTWNDGDNTTVVQGKSYGWTFTPTDPNYETLTGSTVVWPNSNTPNPPATGQKPSGGGSGGGGGSSTPGTVITRSDSKKPGSGTTNTAAGTTSTANPDGSTTTTTTDANTGTVTQTTTRPDGSSTVVESRTDGTVTTTETAANGVRTQTVDRPGSSVTASVTIPGSVDSATVTIPADVTPGMVAVDADTGEVIKLSIPTADGMAVKLDSSANLILVDNSKSFSDVSGGHWAGSSIAFVSSHELFNGTTTSTFSPDSPTTRAQLMTVLARLDGADTSGSALQQGMAWAVAKGISDGTNPNATISRQQLATMLWRYAGSPESGLTLSGPDAGAVAGYAQAAMAWAVENGIMGGYTDGTFKPESPASRAHVAAMVERFCATLVK